jgi:hypothetical protein
MRIGSKASGLGLVLVACGAMAFAGCGGSDGDDGSARPRGGSGGTTARTAGTGGTTGGAPGTGGTTGGSAGTDTTGGTGGTASVQPVCPSPEAVTSPEILSFDDGAVQNAEPSLGMYVYAAEGGTITPPQGLEVQGLAQPGANGTTGAFGFVGAGFPADAYGGGLGVWMNCRNASAATGVKFWLKSDTPVLVKVEVPGTKKVVDGGECVGDDSTCQAARFQVDSTGGVWKEIEVPFSSLTGALPATAFDPSKITGIGFEIVKPATPAEGWGWDVSVDELKWMGMETGGGEGGAPGAGGSPSEGAESAE